jgi:hypothetical protein
MVFSPIVASIIRLRVGLSQRPPGLPARVLRGGHTERERCSHEFVNDVFYVLLTRRAEVFSPLADAQKLAHRTAGALVVRAIGKQKTREELAFYHGFFASLYRGNSGAGKRNRTPDLRITNALLYRLSYSGDEETRV